MALSWIRVDANLRHHPKAIALSCELGDPRAHSYLIDLWSWSSKGAPLGQIRGKNVAAIVEGACGWLGERGALFAALISTGWLDSADGGVDIHDWAEHAGAYILKAQNDARKKQEKRDAALFGANSAQNGANSAQNGARQTQNGAETALGGARPSTSLSQSLVVSSSLEGVQGERRAGFVIEAPTTDPEDWGQDEFWRWAQAKRQESRLVAERPPRHEKLRGWWAEVRGVVRRVADLQEAFYRFGEDKFWQAKNPPLPFSGFISQWSKYMPQLQGARDVGT